MTSHIDRRDETKKSHIPIIQFSTQKSTKKVENAPKNSYL